MHGGRNAASYEGMCVGRAKSSCWRTSYGEPPGLRHVTNALYQHGMRASGWRYAQPDAGGPP